jgi:tetratricopeptide (TPR) repeat protein
MLGLLKGSGFLVEDSQRVVIDGISASGFMTPKDPAVWFPEGGFFLHHSKNSSVRRCSAFLNSNGIGIRNDPKDDNGLGSLVDDCRAYGNTDCGIVSYWPNSDTFSNSTAFLNGNCGIQFYADGIGNLLFSSNISWGNGYGDFRMKGLGVPVEKKTAFAERCISMERFDVANIKQCIIGGPNFYRNDTPPDNISMPNDQVFRDREFADAMNFDFRLQASSPFRQPGTGYKYKGPYPYEPNIYYVKSKGNDNLDGLSMGNAWNTLDFAFKKLKPGDTLYISDGTYSINAPLTLKQVKIRGRGTNTVLIDGVIRIVNSEDMLLERLYFKGTVSLEKSREIAFNNCVFSSDKSIEVVDVNGLNVKHGVLKNTIKLKNCSKVSLSGNIYAASPAIQVDKMENIIYSSYNSYAKSANCWALGGKAIAFEELQKEHDADSRILLPEFVEGDGVVTVKNAYQFVGRGPLGSAIGTYREWQLRFLQLVGPFVYSVGDSSANLEWWTSLPVDVELRWGDTPDCTNKSVITQNSFYSYSLTGLEPGKKYYVKIKPLRIADGFDPGRQFRLPKQDWSTTEFTSTLKTDTAPLTYYVSNEGKNGQNGLSLKTAWKSLQHAADTVRPGDIVLIAGGKYPGTVYFRITGEKGKPITFKAAAPGEKVIIDGMGETLLNGLVLHGKQYYNFDSLNLESFKGGDGSGALFIKGGSNIQVTRCKFGSGWGTGISANGCRDLLVKNCILSRSMVSAKIGTCPNLHVENNVFFYPLIHNLMAGGTDSEPAYVANNIFAESMRCKQQICFVSLAENTKESNNCFFLFWPENERKVINDLTLPEYRETKRTDSFVANPQMPGALGFVQGWQRTSPDFELLFATNPELVRRGIGLQPEAFRDFHFKTDWPYDVAWADKVLAAKKAAAELVKVGKDAEAITAYTDLAKMPMHDLLKSELLEEAALCANRLKLYDQAITIAKNIPLKPLSIKCQMKIMVDNGKYGELIKEFSNKSLDCAPHLVWVCPDLEYLFVDVYAYRSTAYAETGDLNSAEKDLKIMANQQELVKYDSGVGINELAWLRLGDFYRKYMKDDIKALEAYNHIIDRTFKPWYMANNIPKPVLTGDSQTLRDAVQAASEIMRKQGKEDEVFKIQFTILKAQAEALAKYGRHQESIAKFKEALSIKGISTVQKDDCEKKIRGSALADWKKTVNIDKVSAATPMTEETRQKLLKATDNENAGIRQTALDTIIAFAPTSNETMQLLIKACSDKDAGIRLTAVKKLIASMPMTEEIRNTLVKASKDEDEAIRKMAVRTLVEPMVKNMRVLLNGQKWQEMLYEFKDVDFADWQDKSMAGEALYLRGTAYSELKHGNQDNGAKAEKDLNMSLDLSPNSDALLKLAENYQTNLKDEKKTLDAYLKYAKDFFGTRFDRDQCMLVALKASGILRKLGRSEEALKILETSNPKKVAGPYRMQTELAYLDTLVAMSRKADAIDECNKILKREELTSGEKDVLGKKLKELQGNAGQPPKN